MTRGEKCFLHRRGDVEKVPPLIDVGQGGGGKSVLLRTKKKGTKFSLRQLGEQPTQQLRTTKAGKERN